MNSFHLARDEMPEMRDYKTNYWASVA